MGRGDRAEVIRSCGHDKYYLPKSVRPEHYEEIAGLIAFTHNARAIEIEGSPNNVTFKLVKSIA